MKKTYLSIIIGVVGIIIIGGVIFFLSTNKIQAPTEQEMGNTGNTSTWTGFWMTETKNLGADSETQSVLEKYMKKQIGNIMCETKVEDENGSFEQTMYIASDLRMRMDWVATHKQGSVDSHMISDGEYMYMWGGNGPSLKMKIEEEDKVAPNTWEEELSEEQKDKKMSDYLEEIPYNKCREWRVDDSLFKLPSGVEFMDMAEAMKPENIMKWMKKEDGSSAISDEEMNKIQEMIKNQERWE